MIASSNDAAYDVERGRSSAHSAGRRNSPTSTRTVTPENPIAAEQEEARAEAVHGANNVHAELKRDPHLVRFAPNDPENPFNWSSAKKVWILTVYLLNTLTVVSLSAIYAPLAPAVQEEFHVGIYVSRLPLTFFLFGFSVGPLVLSPLGEDYGRRWTFSICFFLFYIFQIPCALAENIATLITCRFIGGILASPILNACGAIPDLWPTSAPQAGWALNFWAVSAEIVVIVPWIGALIERRFDDWRMVFWLSMAVGGALAVVFLVFVPETRHGVILAAKAASLREKTGNNDFYATHERAIHDRHWSKVIKETCIRPIVMLFSEPIIFLFALYDGVNYGVLYLAIEAGALIFGQWGYEEPNVYLFLWSIVIGYFCAFPCYYLQTRAVAYMERRTGTTDVPEWKLIWGFVGGILFPASLFMLAYTSNPSFHWIVPCIALALFGTCSHILFMVVSDYVVDSYGHLASSAVTGQSFLREIMAGVMALCAEPFYRAVGNKWASAILAFIALGLMFIPPLFYLFGPAIRKRSRWYLELKQLQELEREHTKLDMEEQKHEESV